MQAPVSTRGCRDSARSCRPECSPWRRPPQMMARRQTYRDRVDSPSPIFAACAATRAASSAQSAGRTCCTAGSSGGAASRRRAVLVAQAPGRTVACAAGSRGDHSQDCQRLDWSSHKTICKGTVRRSTESMAAAAKAGNATGTIYCPSHEPCLRDVVMMADQYRIALRRSGAPPPSAAPCAVCSTKDSRYRCSCQNVVYCSQKCQAQDWPTHKFVCTAAASSTLRRVDVSGSSSDVSHGGGGGLGAALMRSDTLARSLSSRASSEMSLAERSSFFLGTRGCYLVRPIPARLTSRADGPRLSRHGRAGARGQSATGT